MNHTHGVEEDSDDAYLEEMIEAGREIPPDDLPQLQINGAFFEGELSTKAIFRAVCASYPDEKQPSVCGYCGECSDVRFCLWFLECKDSDSTTFEQFVATSRTTETTDNNSLPNIAQNTATNSPLSTSENKSNNNDQAIIFAMKGVVIGLACSALITVFFVHRDYKARKELKEFAKAEDLEQQEHRYECDTADIRHERNNANMSTKDLEGVSNEFLAQELPDIS